MSLSLNGRIGLALLDHPEKGEVIVAIVETARRSPLRSRFS